MGPTGTEGSHDPAREFCLESYFLDREVFVVPEQVLKDITKGPLRSFILQSRDIQQLLQVWKCLLHTFAAANLPGSHNTAICNAVSAYLESALKSDYEELRHFVLSKETWISVFEDFLDRYQNGRPKPMKQVLGTLIMILSKYMDAATSRLVCEHIARITVPTIILFEPRSRLKASLVSLESLIRKEAVNVVDWLHSAEEWLWANHSSWIPLLGEYCTDLKVPLTRLADEETRRDISPGSLHLYAARILCLVLLLNTHNRDISLPAGMLFSQLCCRLKSVAAAYEFRYYANDDPFWVAPLKYVSLMNLDCLDPIANHVLFPLFKTEPKDFLSFVSTLPLDSIRSKTRSKASNEEYTLLFAILERGKELGLVHDKEDLEKLSPAVAKSSILLDSRDYKHFLVHADENIRIPALSLLTTDPATAKPFSPFTFQILTDTLPYIHAETDSNTRSQLLSILRRLTIRLRGSSTTIQAPSDGSPELENAQLNQKVITTPNAKTFLYWYIDFLENELRPTASYQRHILALKVFLLLLQSGVDNRIDRAHFSKLGQEQQTWRFTIEVFRPGLFRAIADLLLDPYDDVREASMMLLRLFPGGLLQTRSEATGPSPYSQLVAAVSRAEDMAGHTSRADHSDTVGRLHRLLFDFAGVIDIDSSPNRTPYGIVDNLLLNLEQSISCSVKSFHATLHNTPLQGHVSALRYIVGTPNFHAIVSSSQDSVSAWSSFLKRILSICSRIWFGVQDVLCVDSPEREHENPDEDLAGPKDILSFSWRALRESSLLLNAILINTTFAPSGSQNGIGYETLSKIGKLSFEQLAELRHRGAFSTVSQTFASCCLRCFQSDDAATRALPAAWYKDTVGIIYDQASRLTRRSAGLPAIVTGIATSQPGGNLFRQIMEELQNISRTSPMETTDKPDLELPQVHALNCLKDIFTNTNLAQSTEPYVMPSLNISANCLGSNIWAIRNCGLMLFRSLINRMSRPTPESRRGIFIMPGSDSNHSVPFEKYHGLVPLLSGLLDTPVSNEKDHESEASRGWDLSILTERVFPALELIGNKAPARPSSDDDILKRLALSQFSNPVWGIRDHAARTYVTLVKRADLLQTAQELSSPELRTQLPNQVHGLLLCIKYLLQKLWESPAGYWCGNINDIMGIIENVFRSFYDSKLAPYIKACLFEIVANILEASIGCGQEDKVLPCCDYILKGYLTEQLLGKALESSSGSSISRSSSLLVRFLSFDLVFLKVLKDSPEEVAQFLEAISVADIDGAHWVLDRLHRCFRYCAALQLNSIKLYKCAIEITQSSLLKTAAMSYLAESLESFYERKTQLPPELQFLKRWAKSVDFFTEQSGAPLWDRARFNASIHLAGCLFPLRVDSTVALESSTKLRSDLRKMAQTLSSALAEETEFSTRYSAICAMKCLILGLERMDAYSPYSASFIEIYFLLYDMLNDDDEELRDASTHIASNFFSDLLPTPELPLTTNVTLARFVTQFFPISHKVFEGALFRFMGNRGDKVSFTPIRDQLNELQKESTVLFLEEKQNLYIDEVREIEIWSSVLAQLDHSGPPTDLGLKFVSWVCEGLSELREELRKKQARGILGWMSGPDALAMSMRLIHGAKVLLATNAFGCPAYKTSTIHDTLQDMLEIGESAGIYEPWIAAVENALNQKSTSYGSSLQASFNAVRTSLVIR
ncbi:HEAT repeat protein [Coccidioides immitis RS]|uniref:HEAT repeat protein n=1 Tax=Coccidioides immitis (strain RS) TaxID=246410 RepID=J3KFP3_COCIM|nr:HEAT repeat protein [Coccidioides immitis RS]EAS34462.3 HEAT repeat protein [Coccidioides immitis RS]